MNSFARPCPSCPSPRDRMAGIGCGRAKSFLAVSAAIASSITQLKILGNCTFEGRERDRGLPGWDNRYWRGVEWRRRESPLLQGLLRYFSLAFTERLPCPEA
jgi:hypothetical protein